MAEHIIDKFSYGGNTYKLQDNVSGYTSNTGTVTSVGISNATNGGLSVSGSPVTGSGSITVGHSNILTSAQTTQAVYPIKIDKNGHISSYGSAVTITDEKVATSACEVLAVGSYYYPILGTNTTSATTKYYDSTGLRYGGGGTNALLILGDASNAKYGSVRLYNSSGGYTNLVGSGTSSTNNLIYLPSTGGTLALTSNIPTVPTITLNGSTTTSPSFYAPTGAGISNYFLKSSGSGAPTWSQPIKYGTSLPASGDFTGQVFILIE